MNNYLHKIRTKEIQRIKDYLGDFQKNPLINDVKLISKKKDAKSRKDFAWEGIAIKFNFDISISEAIGEIVKFRPDEYWGDQEGYHLFWWD